MIEIEYDLQTQPYTGQRLVIDNSVVPDILSLRPQGLEVLRIDPKGDVYWKGRLVESDDEFKLAMLDLAKVFKGEYKHG